MAGAESGAGAGERGNVSRELTAEEWRVLRNLWNGDIPLTRVERRWIRQALDAQEPEVPEALSRDA